MMQDQTCPTVTHQYAAPKPTAQLPTHHYRDHHIVLVHQITHRDRHGHRDGGTKEGLARRPHQPAIPKLTELQFCTPVVSLCMLHMTPTRCTRSSSDSPHVQQMIRFPHPPFFATGMHTCKTRLLTTTRNQSCAAKLWMTRTCDNEDDSIAVWRSGSNHSITRTHLATFEKGIYNYDKNKPEVALGHEAGGGRGGRRVLCSLSSEPITTGIPRPGRSPQNENTSRSHRCWNRVHLRYAGRQERGMSEVDKRPRCSDPRDYVLKATHQR